MSSDLCFADRVIQRAVKQLKDGLKPSPQDYQLIRDTFKRAGGSWEKFLYGDINHIRLLKTTVKVWVENHATSNKG